MAYTKSALSKLNKNDLICIALDMQKTQNSILSDMKNELTDMKNELSELRKNYNKLEADLKVSKSVTEAMKNHIIVLERKCWSNEQYSRRECLEISGIPSDTEAGKLEETLLKVFEKLDVDVDPKNVEDCHWLKTRNSSKKVIIKLSKRKDADKIRQVKKKLKSLNLESMGISSPIFINDSLCAYYKKLWAKCKKLWLNKYIYGFWVSYGLIKIKVSEISLPVTITHDVDLENKFAGNPLLKDNPED